MLKKILALSIIVSSSLMAESMEVGHRTATVFKSEPVFTTISETIPVENCYEAKEDASTGGNSVVGTLGGGVLGGVLGHQIGGGTGKTVATIGGAVLGSVIGNNIASEPKQESYKVVKKCDVNYKQVSKQIISSYINYAKINGVEIKKESASPMSEIIVTNIIEY